MVVKVCIELGDDGTYGAYIPDENPLGFGVIGEGNSANEAIADFMNVFNDFKADGEPVPENVTFDFCYDMPSFLSYYSKKLSLAGLERITGVAQGQLSHYLTGRRNPSKKTVEKIQHSIHEFANELSQVKFV